MTYFCLCDFLVQTNNYANNHCLASFIDPGLGQMNAVDLILFKLLIWVQ